MTIYNIKAGLEHYVYPHIFSNLQTCLYQLPFGNMDDCPYFLKTRRHDYFLEREAEFGIYDWH